MAELADALDSGSSARKGVEVQVLSSALVNNGVSRHRGKPRFFLQTRLLSQNTENTFYETSGDGTVLRYDLAADVRLFQWEDSSEVEPDEVSGSAVA